ncbi:MAG: AAC(3) family N-acetyltransferase [Ardenticatenaceae bacterium]|nr:AAC(3) family N-acetyltransferase [Ardenticatenaceae bacterium]MCB9445566.1 AAC(3) family N-acetyltransferase [Ardenticatenaceae bacterium]
MGEIDTIQGINSPRTRRSLADDLRQLDIKPGMTVLVHSSLKSIGWVNGGPVTVIQALQDVLTSAGTLVMPSHSGDLSDPAHWQNPPIPQDWHELVRQTMPAFEPALTPTRGMGRIAELFRTWPDVQRSSHPQVSFAAWGQQARFVTDNHGLSNSLGEKSPLARVYDLAGYVLLLGVGYDSNTSFHLAEYRANRNQPFKTGAPVLRNGRSHWTPYDDIEFNDDLFPQIGAEMEAQTDIVTIGQAGSAACRFYPQKPGVDFAVNWLTNYHPPTTSSQSRV